MKKFPFYMLCAAMLATASVVSCVKNDESASVTNLRNAKTEQLKSVATMNLAQAKATEILATAEAKLKEAEAAYQQALALVQTTDAAQKQVAVDKAKATLARDIELLLVTANTQIEVQKLAFQTALDAYNTYVAGNPNPFLDALVTVYQTKVGTLYTAIGAVNTAKAAVLGLQADVVTAQKWLATETETQKQAIIQAQAELDAYNAIPANDRPAAYKAWQDALATVDNIKAGLKSVVDPVNAVHAAVGAKVTALKADPYYKGVVDVVTNSNNLTYTYVQYDGTKSAAQTSSTSVGGTLVATQSAAVALAMTKITVTAVPGGLPTYSESSVSESYSPVSVNGVLLNQQISTLTGQEKTTKKAYEDAVKAAEGTAPNTKTLAELETAVVTAQEAYNTALATNTDVAAKLQALNDAKGLVTTFKSSVSTEFDAWAKATAELAAWNAWSAKLSATNKDAYAAAVAAITAEYAKYDPAHKAYTDVNTQVITQTTIAASLESLYNELVNKEALVAAATAKLGVAKATLAELEHSASAPNAKEAALALANKKVADAELQLAGIQKEVDTLKAKIDAELNK